MLFCIAAAGCRNHPQKIAAKIKVPLTSYLQCIYFLYLRVQKKRAAPPECPLQGCSSFHFQAETVPSNKHASFRYRILDQCFRHRRYRIGELVAAVNTACAEEYPGKPLTVRKRTIYGDIQFMRSAAGWSADIRCINGCYAYADLRFSITRQKLSPREVAALRTALSVLSQFEGLPQAKALQSLLEREAGPTDGFNPTLVQFETNPLVRGLEWLSPLYEAAAQGRVLRVHYRPFQEAQVQPLFFHPYLLKEYRNRWFVFGHAESESAIRNLALDRIESLHPSLRPFRANTDWDAAAHFHPIVGVTRYEGVAPRAVLFEAAARCADYIETKPIHHSQTLVEKSADKSVFRLFVIPNPELEAELRRWGEAVRVLENP
jgi:predicted DNA-binding transcriptional regulator YafY